MPLKEGTGHTYWWFERKKHKLFRLCKRTPAFTQNLVEWMLSYICIVFKTHYRLSFNEMCKNHKSRRRIAEGKNEAGFWPLHWKEERKKTLGQNTGNMYSKNAINPSFNCEQGPALISLYSYLNSLRSRLRCHGLASTDKIKKFSS